MSLETCQYPPLPPAHFQKPRAAAVLSFSSRMNCVTQEAGRQTASLRQQKHKRPLKGISDMLSDRLHDLLQAACVRQGFAKGIQRCRVCLPFRASRASSLALAVRMLTKEAYSEEAKSVIEYQMSVTATLR